MYITPSLIHCLMTVSVCSSPVLTVEIPSIWTSVSVTRVLISELISIATLSAPKAVTFMVPVISMSTPVACSKPAQAATYSA